MTEHKKRSLHMNREYLLLFHIPIKPCRPTWIATWPWWIQALAARMASVADMLVIPAIMARIHHCKTGNL